MRTIRLSRCKRDVLYCFAAIVKQSWTFHHVLSLVSEDHSSRNNVEYGEKSINNGVV